MVTLVTTLDQIMLAGTPIFQFGETDTFAILSLRRRAPVALQVRWHIPLTGACQ